MKKEKEKLYTIKKSNYQHKKYSNPIIKKLMLATCYNRYLSEKKLNEKFNFAKKLFLSSNNYKDPNFYNENSLDTQLFFLRKLSGENMKQSILTKKLSISSGNKTFPMLKRNNTENLNIKSNLEDRKSIISNYKKLLLNKRNTFFFNRAKTESNLINDSFTKRNKLTPEKLYKIIFKSQHNKDKGLKSIILNKYNIKYAENEEQYNFIIKKEYQKEISEGKKIKSKNVAPFIKMKLDEAQEKVNFMKDIMDYSYPLFVLSKIKVKQKNLRELKKQRYKNKFDYLNEKERRLKEYKIQNDNRTKYLLKSFSFLKCN